MGSDMFIRDRYLCIRCDKGHWENLEERRVRGIYDQDILYRCIIFLNTFFKERLVSLLFLRHGPYLVYLRNLQALGTENLLTLF